MSDRHLSFRILAARLGMYPSRLVAVIDYLEKRSLIERQPSKSDRRLYALHLTKSGKKQFSAIGAIARDHGRDLLDALPDEEHLTLTELLERIAKKQGLQEGSIRVIEITQRESTRKAVEAKARTKANCRCGRDRPQRLSTPLHPRNCYSLRFVRSTSRCPICSSSRGCFDS
jgi:DNA-binding MarR family transcriptional regulator